MESETQEQYATQLRMALSYREKANRLAQDSARALAKETVSKEQYDALQSFYRDHLNRADRAIDNARKAVLKELAAHQKKLRRLEQDRDRIRQKAGQPGASAKQINIAHRELSDRIAATKAQLAKLEQLHTVEESGDIGGFIDHPLDEYEASMRTTVERPASTPASVPKGDRIAAGVAVVVALAALFLPWLHGAGVSGSLVTIGRPLVMTGALAEPLPFLLRYGWVGAGLVSIAGSLIVLLPGHHRPAAWLQLLLGMIMALASVAPAILLTMRGSDPASVTTFLHAMGTGAWLFGAAGLAMLALGARRRDLAADTPLASWGEVVLIVGAVLLVFLGGSFALAQLPRGGVPAFQASLSEPWDGTIVFTLSNPGRSPIGIAAPWSPDAPIEPEGIPQRRRYGISVAARYEADSPFHTVPSGVQEWRFQGQATVPGESVTVLPGLSVDLLLDTGRLFQELDDLDGLRVALRNARGRTIEEAVLSLPGPPPPEDTPTDLEAYGPRPSPTIPPNDIPEPALPEPAEEAAAPPEPQPRPTPEEPRTTVRVRGMIGDRIVFAIAYPNGERDSQTVGQGEEVLPGWVLESISRSPLTAVLRHRDSDETVSAIRGRDAHVPLP